MNAVRAMSDPPQEDGLPDRAAEPIGLIGIGLMGTVIAQRLLQAGYRVWGWDLDPRRHETLQGLGGHVASSVVDLFENCSRMILSLPSHETVSSVLHSAQQSLQPAQIIIDMSTGDPGAAVLQAETLASHAVVYVDATVSGSSEQLKNHQAVIVVGATSATFETCRDLFDCLAEKTFLVGPAGSGARMKLVTNLVLGLNRAALAEGLCFAQHLGLDLEQALQLLRESMSYSRIMDTKGEKMIRGDFTAQARLSQHLKDVRLMIAAAQDAYLPLTETHRLLLERAEQMGLGQLDNSAILNVIAAGRPSSETI